MKTVSVICHAVSLTILSYMNDQLAPKGVSGCSSARQYCVYPVHLYLAYFIQCGLGVKKIQR